MNSATCIECKKTFPAEEMVAYGQNHVCAWCKDRFFQKVKEGVDVGGNFVYGGFWIRVLAYLLDYVITMVIVGIAAFAMGLALAGLFMGNDVAVGIIAQVMGMIAAILYEVLFIGGLAATPGKMACGLKVVLPDGGRVSYSRALGRVFAKMISGVILCIGYIMIGFDDEKRSLHDRICNTRVVKK